MSLRGASSMKICEEEDALEVKKTNPDYQMTGQGILLLVDISPGGIGGWITSSVTALLLLKVFWWLSLPTLNLQTLIKLVFKPNLL